jgi:hypothetical protein
MKKNKMKLIESIDQVREEARTWKANDGGLTMAAGDLLAACNAAERHFKNDNPFAMLQWAGDPCDCQTGAEMDLTLACIEWAKEKIQGALS